ncbi:DUF362 domain-containing protein [candidate division CSSED10-310 bacterium]|uniref:DUF362 domain-containing protein n=1 Tax=candidate division CSSED10-310 bacterium TaxID=2855610 RepID=A0ABV6Z0X6_UNCC1
MTDKNKAVYVIFGEQPAFLMATLFKKITWLNQAITAADRVVIKPNLLVPRVSKSGATDPILVDQPIFELRQRGVDNITLAEGAWLGADTWQACRVCGYDRLIKKYDLKFVDLGVG